MSYKITAKNRRLNKHINKFISIIKFDAMNLSHSHKTIFIWSLIWIISLFLTWFTSNWNEQMTWTAFNKLLWLSWYLIFICYLKILFILFSKKSKDFLKKIINLNIDDHILLSFIWIFAFAFSLNSFVLINNFAVFQSQIHFQQWIILNLVWNILLNIGAIFNLFSKTNVWILVNTPQTWEENILDQYLENNSMNTKLPF